MHLQETVQQELNNLVDSGQVKEIIRTQLSKTVTDIIKDTMQSYSAFGKKLKDEVSKAIDVDLSKFELLDYNTIVSSIVKEQLDATLYENAIKPITDQVKSYVGSLERKEYKLSEIMTEFINELRGDSSVDSGRIFLEVEQKYESYWIGFDEGKQRNNFSRFNCKYSIAVDVKTGKMFSYKAGDYRPFFGDIRTEKYYSGFDAFLFKLYAQQCVIIIDEDDCDLEIERDFD